MTLPKPYFERNRALLYQGDVLDVLRQLPSESVHCCVTSPPYWGLRDYGVPGQIGLEATPEEYTAKMVEVFREVRRVLRSDGTCWVNLGDSYAQAGGRKDADIGREAEFKNRAAERGYAVGSNFANYGARMGEARSTVVSGLKPKDMVGIPWRVAFALQADGWYLRSDIIWSKPNPMPESVTDRPTKAHEYIFLLSKSARYFYDADAIKDPITETSVVRLAQDVEHQNGSSRANGGAKTNGTMKAVVKKQDMVGNRRYDGFNVRWDATEQRPTRNKRTVWEIATQPYPEAHFATFPEDLVMPCIKAGTSERGVCPVCGAPWRRETSVEYTNRGGRVGNGPRNLANRAFSPGFEKSLTKHVDTTGWTPTCTHDAERIPATVLDIFAGSGTTLLVAQRLGRHGVGIELSPNYCEIAANRLQQGVLAL